MESTNGKAPAPLKPRLLALVEQGRVEQRAFVERLSEAERATVGVPDAWAAKDHVAHIAAWKADAAREIAATRRGEAYPVESILTFNPRVFAGQQRESWEAVLAEAEEADEALRSAVEECSEDDLTGPARFPWREGLPLWTTPLVSDFEHPAEHYAQYYLEAGDVERARTVREGAVETARRFIGEREEFGYMVYNLGCFYANIGQSSPAMAALREALAIAPQLAEGLGDDPELAPLRGEPAFRELAAG